MRYLSNLEAVNSIQLGVRVAKNRLRVLNSKGTLLPAMNFTEVGTTCIGCV